MKLQDIFLELRGARLCKNAYDFSTNYLGKSKSYYSVLKANRTEPSIDTLAMLETALQQKAIEYENDKYEIFTLRRQQLLSLSASVRSMLNQRCVDALGKGNSEVTL